MLSLLCAYPYVDRGVVDLIRQNEARVRFVLDSGAFTAWKAGNEIKIDDYCKFIDSLPFKPWRYFALDVVGDPHGTMKNYQIMLERGYKPVPIFTRGEDPSVLEDYYKTSDVVGIGGLVGTEGNKGFVKGIMKRVNGRKVHWLGFTNFDFVKVYKPYMCDSSSWEGGARFGVAQLYMGRGHRDKVSREDFRKGINDACPKVQAIKRLGMDPREAVDPKKWNGGMSFQRRLGAASGVAQSLDVEKHLGTHQFLAFATAYAGKMLVDAYNLIQEKK